MYRLKTLTGNRLWARCIVSQATEVGYPRRCAEPHDGARTPALRPHRLTSGSQKPAYPYDQLMQQRPTLALYIMP